MNGKKQETLPDGLRVAHDVVHVATENALEHESVRAWLQRAGLRLKGAEPVEARAQGRELLMQIVEWPRGLAGPELVERLRRAQAAATLLIIPEHVGADLGELGLPDDWDFVRRPCDPRELVWRAERALSRLLRRESGVIATPALVRGPLRADLATGHISADGLLLALRRTERDVLLYLMRHAPRCIGTDELQREVLHSHGSGGAVRNQIYELRRKLRAAGLGEAIVSKCCDGYRLRWSG
jgi:DNA-binding response OmpR family regulator